MKKFVFIVIILSMISCKKKIDEFGCWEIYYKCSYFPNGNSEETCGHTEADVKKIVADFIKDNPDCNSVKYKFVK